MLWIPVKRKQANNEQGSSLNAMVFRDARIKHVTTSHAIVFLNTILNWMFLLPDQQDLHVVTETRTSSYVILWPQREADPSNPLAKQNRVHANNEIFVGFSTIE